LALSTVVTTLIILVVSVLLAGVVTYFAINVVSTRVQQESVQLSFPHVWVDAAGYTQAAVLVKNTGGRDIVINQIQVRGIAAAYSTNVYNYTTSTASDLSAKGTLAASALVGDEPITLSSGSMLEIYISNPTSVSINDIGTTIGITVLTTNAMYYTETNVQGTTTTLPTS
jgi:hypothetical protein